MKVYIYRLSFKMLYEFIANSDTCDDQM